MTREITRRDFLNGTRVAIGASLGRAAFEIVRLRLTYARASEMLGGVKGAGTAADCAPLALAMPAFEETSKDWRNQDDFAVTFLDRYGNEIGTRGIRLDNSVELDEMPDHLIRAVLATEPVH